MFEVEEVIYLGEGIRVSAAHEAVTDQADAQLFHDKIERVVGDSALNG
jgi:hypothetical protein